MAGPHLRALSENTDRGRGPGAATNSDERAEAQFYLGEWHLLRNHREEAIKALKAAAQSCPPWFTEHAGAVAELKRLANNSCGSRLNGLR